jgi:hypothetical protein
LAFGSDLLSLSSSLSELLEPELEAAFFAAFFGAGFSSEESELSLDEDDPAFFF